MCTAIGYITDRLLFGRNLDVECGYGEKILLSQRRHPLRFRHEGLLDTHSAIMGIGVAHGDFPLLFDAVNEHGVCIAALNFPHYASYGEPRQDSASVAVYELIPYLLSKYESAREASRAAKELTVTGERVSPDMPSTPLHFILSDYDECYILESKEGRITPIRTDIRVLTNSPPYAYQTTNLQNYAVLSPGQVKKSDLQYPFFAYSNGMGALGLPGDYSSCSRFVRAAYLLRNSHPEYEPVADVGHFFHLLHACAMPRGSVITEDGKEEYTRYSCCIDALEKCYYYVGYENSRISALEMSSCTLDGDSLLFFDMRFESDIYRHR